MDPSAIAGLGMLSVFVVLFVILIAVLWCLVPFLILGTNSRLAELIKQNKKIIELLEQRPH